MTPVQFTPERLRKFKAIVSKYETKASALLPALYLAQEQFQFLSAEVLLYVSELVEIPAAQVFEVAAFYSLLKKKDMGKWCLQVCNNITCTMMGSETLLRTIREELGISAGEVTADRQFSVVPVPCLGSCDTAPVVQINDEYFEKMSADKLREVIANLKRA